MNGGELGEGSNLANQFDKADAMKLSAKDLADLQTQYRAEHGPNSLQSPTPETLPQATKSTENSATVNPTIETPQHSISQMQETIVSRPTQPVSVDTGNKGINWDTMKTQEVPIAELNRIAKEKELANQTGWQKVKSRVGGFFKRSKN